MIILTIRTDKPEAEVGLFENDRQLAYEVWQAYRQLAEAIHQKISYILSSQSKTPTNLQAIIAYSGPGSFTGLRIGLSVANALAYSLQIPIIGIENEEKWLERGMKDLQAGKNDVAVMPQYGAPVHITEPKH